MSSIPNVKNFTDEFLSALKERVPAYSHHVLKLAEASPELFREFSEPMLEWANISLGKDYLDRIIDGYVFFVSEVNMSQINYEKTGRYEYSTFKEVYEVAYGDEEFMEDYHWGVFASTFAWEHHLNLSKLFSSRFLERLDKDSNILDLGAGSGIYNLLALRQCPSATAVAVDISPTSVKESRNTAVQLGLGDRTQHICSDATTWQAEEMFDAAISCFVLEHLEHPELLLLNLSRNVKPHGLVYVTTALTASEIDHIYEYRRESEVVEMCERAGFRVLEYQSLASSDTPVDRYFLPRSIGLVLQVRKGPIW